MKKVQLIMVMLFVALLSNYSHSGCGPIGTDYYLPSVNQQDVSVVTDIWFLPELNTNTSGGCWGNGTIILSGYINIHLKSNDSVVQKIDVNEFYYNGEATYSDVIKFKLSDSLEFSTSYYVTKDNNTLSHCDCGEYWFNYKSHLSDTNNWFHWQSGLHEYLWEFTTESGPEPEPNLKLNKYNITQTNVYPNPSSEKITIEGDFDRFVILDFKGGVVEGGNNNSLYVGGLAKGIYFIIIMNKGVLTDKIRFVKN